MKKEINQPLTQGEFADWALATKQTLNTIEGPLNGHTGILNEHTRLLGEHTRQLASIEKKLEPLEQIATDLKAIRENTTSMLSLYYRMDWRTREMGAKLDLDIDKIDAQYPGPFPKKAAA